MAGRVVVHSFAMLASRCASGRLRGAMGTHPHVPPELGREPFAGSDAVRRDC